MWAKKSLLNLCARSCRHFRPGWEDLNLVCKLNKLCFPIELLLRDLNVTCLRWAVIPKLCLRLSTFRGNILVCKFNELTLCDVPIFSKLYWSVMCRFNIICLIPLLTQNYATMDKVANCCGDILPVLCITTDLPVKPCKVQNYIIQPWILVSRKTNYIWCEFGWHAIHWYWLEA